jgi:cysteine sulfinate desulfinase/cysteine desulfurase-like protein
MNAENRCLLQSSYKFSRHLHNIMLWHDSGLCVSLGMICRAQALAPSRLILLSGYCHRAAPCAMLVFSPEEAP